MIIPEHNLSAVDCTPCVQAPHTASQPSQAGVEAERAEHAPDRGAPVEGLTEEDAAYNQLHQLRSQQRP